MVAANLPNDCKHKTVTYKMSHPEEHRRLSQQDLVSFVQNRELFDAQACSAWIQQQSTQPKGKSLGSDTVCYSFVARVIRHVIAALHMCVNLIQVSSLLRVRTRCYWYTAL